MSKSKTHIIIGNSAASLSAVKAIRKMGDLGRIIMISHEDCNAYSPVLTTYYVAGDIQRSDLFLVDHHFYKEQQVETLFGRKAVSIDTAKQIVHLDDRSRIPYDDLLIATGASARELERVDRDASKFVATLRTIADADKIKGTLERTKDVVFIGAGLVSLQTLRAVLKKVQKNTVIVGSYQILSQQMDTEAAAIIQKRIEAEGVTFLFGREVERVSRKGDRAEVSTNYGERIAADLIVVGKGVRPNVDPVRDTAIKLGTGIRVDGQMRTNIDNVFAAGDVAEGENCLSREMEVIATWSNACCQGEIAGMNMAGCPAQRQGQFRDNVTTIMGLAAVSIGLSKPAEGEFEELTYSNEEQKVYRKLIFDGPRLVGAVLLGSIDDAGVIRNCIAGGLDVSPWKERLVKAPMNFGGILYGQELSMPFFGL
jgi:NAD(P)H-nitrite reductase large subunit